MRCVSAERASSQDVKTRGRTLLSEDDAHGQGWCSVATFRRDVVAELCSCATQTEAESTIIHEVVTIRLSVDTPIGDDLRDQLHDVYGIVLLDGQPCVSQGHQAHSNAEHHLDCMKTAFATGGPFGVITSRSKRPTRRKRAPPEVTELARFLRTTREETKAGRIGD